MSHSQLHHVNAYTGHALLSFEASIDYWQAQPGFNLTRAALNSEAVRAVDITTAV